MKKKQKINKAVNYGEWLLLGLTALFLCVLFVLRERPAPSRGIAVRTSSSRAPGALPAAPSSDSTSDADAASPSDSTPAAAPPSDSVPVSAAASDNNAASASDADRTSAANTYAAPVSDADAAPDSASNAATPVPNDADNGRVNINTADVAELCALPGIGEALARRIIDYRETHGDFARPEDVMRVAGIGEGKFSAMKSLITV